MKIRTDFVTNSSSYCTTEIIIDNPVLLEILVKYKDLGLFRENDPIFGFGSYQSINPEFSAREGSPAFYYFEATSEEHESLNIGEKITPWNLNPDTDAPYTVEEVLEAIIELIDDGKEFLDSNLHKQLRTELNERKNEILAGFESISWSQDRTGDDLSQFLYTFDPKNGPLIDYNDETGYSDWLNRKAVRK